MKLKSVKASLIGVRKDGSTYVVYQDKEIRTKSSPGKDNEPRKQPSRKPKKKSA